MVVVAGSTYKWNPTFLKDGAAYDVSAGVVTISFLPPTGVAQTFAMTALITSASYINATTLFTNALAGEWRRSYKVVLSGVVLESPEIVFTVKRSISGS